MSKENMFSKIILGSVGMTNIPIYTVHMRYPRPIHGEVMTHRDFSRNARSSRAVPVRTMLDEVRSNPYVPWHWGANQKGMQASTECNEPLVLNPEDAVTFAGRTLAVSRTDAWLLARDNAVEIASAYMNAGYHKQNANRLLEPFAWIDTLITSTNWANFFHLRNHKDAEPHFRDLSQMTLEAFQAHGDLQRLENDQWHRPYITDDDIDHGLDIFDTKAEFDAWLNKISSARCARISYKPFDGDASYEREIERYEMLTGSGAVHASPFEHQAKPDTRTLYQRIRMYKDGTSEYLPRAVEWDNPSLQRNFTGWIQNRALIPNETKFDTWG